MNEEIVKAFHRASLSAEKRIRFRFRTRIGFDTSKPLVSANHASSNQPLIGWDFGARCFSQSRSRRTNENYKRLDITFEN